MKIASIESIPIAVPFSTGVEATTAGWSGGGWRRLSVLLVRVETDAGIVGWGEAFSYTCLPAVKASLDHMVAPLALGQDAGDIAGLSLRIQRALHLFGRYGINVFALSGLDIALWDVAGKAAGMPVHRLLGGAVRERVTGYASLYRYGDPEAVAARARLALDQGYRHVKIHEQTEANVRATREALGPEVPMMVDTNCPWTPAEAREMAMRLAPYDLHWLEEPIFPPEDFDSLARLRRETGLAIAAGENACTAFEFEKMLAAGAVTHAQPSVTKVGGLTEMRRVADLARVRGVACVPHSPYFGPGFVATLHAMAALPEEALLERFHLDLEASLYGDLIDGEGGEFRVPDGPGLGIDPDPAVIAEYAIEAA